MSDISVSPVGYVQSPFRQKFAIPRQPGLVPAARGAIELLPPYDAPESVRGLEAFSHIWVTFLFHAVDPAQSDQMTVRPPRLGGNDRVGVFASRAPFRPNRIGLSVLTLERIDLDGGVRLLVSGLDLLDATPVLDIRPYVAYCDALPEAQSGFAAQRPVAELPVTFSAAALDFVSGPSSPAGLRELIEQTLALDARPAFHDDPDRTYAMRLYDLDVYWKVTSDSVRVTEIRTVS